MSVFITQATTRAAAMVPVAGVDRLDWGIAAGHADG